MIERKGDPTQTHEVTINGVECIAVSPDEYQRGSLIIVAENEMMPFSEIDGLIVWPPTDEILYEALAMFRHEYGASILK